jgi:hypothetical protein
VTRGRESQALAATVLGHYFGVTLLLEQSIPIPTRSNGHAFDLASSDGRIVGECKNFFWTKTSNVPSGKITTLKEAASHLAQLPPM